MALDVAPVGWLVQYRNRSTYSINIYIIYDIIHLFYNCVTLALQLFLLKAVGNNKQPSGENTVERLRLSKKNLQSNTPSHAFTAFCVLYQLENTKTQKITILWFQAWNMATRQNMFVEKFDSTCSIYSNPFLWYNSLTSLFGCLRLSVNYTVHIRQVPSASPTAGA